MLALILSLSFFPSFFKFSHAPSGAVPLPEGIPSIGVGLAFERFPNGARAIAKEARWAPAVAIDFWFRAGSRYDPPGKWGMAHLLEHLLMRAGKVNLAIEALGGEANAVTSRDFVRFWALLPSDRFEEALTIFSKALSAPKFTREELEAEKRVVLREIEAIYEAPLSLALEAAFGVAYRHHPYGHPVEGTPKSLATITLGDLQAFHQERFLAPNLCIVVVGNVDRKRVLSLVREASSLFPSQELPHRGPIPVVWPKGVRKVTLRLPVESATVLVALPAPPVAEFDEVCSTDLALVLLAKGEGARLKRALLAEGGLAQSVGADFLTRIDPGLFCAYATCSLKNVPEVEAVLLKELKRLSQEEPSEQELKWAKGLLVGMFLMDSEGMTDMAGMLGFYETLGSHELALSYIERVMAVSAKEVTEVARRYLDPSRAVVVKILPKGGELKRQ